ncbi:MAG: response regulator [Oligoflexus sp.]
MPKILIVDDEVDICEMMSFTFANQGFETFTAHDAAEAFQLVIQEDPDLVISDIRMPKGGGMKLLADIKKHNANRPKVFLITGYSDNTKEEALSAGAEDVLAKPIKLQDLVNRVSNALP